ncbi:hypothetical protein QYE76_007016 [Lolium multiflorum]|uniref:Reverse transcriptase Ty1/copia-type domain-containing protein n=1 Tax=Lolium multiflorum TaxID=4521 RepID=A0AAD8W4X3_LOLMU|nr:hypothetical protein QYE76_007016 [Lolium multiflorum]
MAEEIAALERTGTWDVVTPPPSVRPITCKWVYKIKTRFDGSLKRYKARLVARGFQQEHGRDYDETFAPDQVMALQYVPSELQLADFFTKAQTRAQHGFFLSKLSIVDPP